jgi:hypothetical protein
MPAGMATVYDLDAGVMLDFEDAIYLLDAFDTPLMNGSMASGATPIGRGTANQIKVEWQDENLLLPRSTVQTTANSAATELVVAAGDGIKFATGDIVQDQATGEKVRVTSVNYGTDTLTITRSWGDVAAGSLTAADVLQIVGTVLPEGSDPPTARTKDRNLRFNYTQIFGPVPIEMSGTQQIIRRYGVTSEWDHQLANRLKEMMVMVEQTMIYGERVNEENEKYRALGGLEYFITTNIDSSSGAITKARIKAQLKAIADAGGTNREYTLHIGSDGIEDFSTFNSNELQVFRSDRGTGEIVQYLDSDFGRVSKVWNRNLHTTDALLLPRGLVTWDVLRPLFMRRTGVTGDADKAFFLMEASMRVRGQRHMARWSGLT